MAPLAPGGHAGRNRQRLLPRRVLRSCRVPVATHGDTAVVGVPQPHGRRSDTLVERGHRTGGEHELVVVGVMTPIGEIQELVLNLAPVARL